MNIFVRGFATSIVLFGVALAALTTASFDLRPAKANPHAGQSVNVAVCCGADISQASDVVNGGFLPTTGDPGELGDFTFSAIAVADVSAANLTAFDTFVLNVASEGLACDISLLSASQKAAIVSFVASGNKLVMYDSECTPAGGVDYSWLPFPFTTDNPGAQGAQGTVNIVEENNLSTSDPADSHYIDAVALGNNTDAIGDMNVMVTLDPNWCLDMSGTNSNSVTGPVHTYARFGSVGSVGLMIYNGMDVDDMDDNVPDWLRKIWLQELQQPFNPDNLPCAVPVAGIALTPDTATNDVGTGHTVTATITDLLGDPTPDIEVTFEVIDGPNIGATGADTTDANGEATFTYTSNGTAGTDTVEACFINEQEQEVCDQATKEWVIPPTSSPTLSPSPSPTAKAAAALPNTGGAPGTASNTALAIGLMLIGIAATTVAAGAYSARRSRN